MDWEENGGSFLRCYNSNSGNNEEPNIKEKAIAAYLTG